MEKQPSKLTAVTSPFKFTKRGPVPHGAAQGKCDKNVLVVSHEKSDERLKIEVMEKDTNAEATIPSNSSSPISTSVRDTSQGQIQALKSNSTGTSAGPKETSGKQKRQDDYPGSPELSKLRTLSKVRKYICCSAGRFKTIILATVAYGVTSYCTVTAPLVNSPLGLVSPTQSFLVLHILAKISDIGLGLAVASMWESVRWSSVFSGVGISIPSFFALDGSTGFLGLASTLISNTRIGHASRFWSLVR
jgi:hypothetical protein